MKLTKSFFLDLKSFKKHIFLKYIVLFFINFFILSWTYYESKTSEVSLILILLGILIIIGFIFWRNANKQMELLSKTVYEFEGKVLKHYGIGESCGELDLSTIQSLKYEILFGIKRVLIKTEQGKTYTYSRIQDMESFIKNLENYSGKQIQKLERNKWELTFKFILIYLPSFIVLILVQFPKTLINMNIFFLIINLNTIFFLRGISENKLEGGIPERIVSRINLILIIFFFYQFYNLFYSN